MIYLDYNATTPVRPEVREVLLPFFTDEWGNPSSTYAFGARMRKVANTTNITFRGIASDALLMLLDQEGICASSGSACLADSDEPSHVVRAMKPDSGASRQMVRFSVGAGNTVGEIESTVMAVRRAVAVLKG